MNNQIPVVIRMDDGVSPPVYATSGSAGFDFVAKEDVLIGAFSTAKVPTGLYMSIPPGFEIQVRPRSGLSLNTALRIANAPGTIDSDYRGEVMIIIENTASLAYQVRRGDKVAQGVLCPFFRAQWRETTELDATDRGEGGFGSTG